MDVKEKQQKISQLRAQIAACIRCPLHKTRTNTVPGEGDVSAQIMFIGEAPGRNEDLQGKPFVGRAGDVFDKLLNSIGITRDQIYLCNILKCRPPENRNPLSSEISSCVGSLDLQIKIVSPKVICTMGNFATTYIFDKFQIPPAKISSVAGKIIAVETLFGSIKIVPLFHPAVATYDVNKTNLLIDQFQVLKPFCPEGHRVCSENIA
ncbi:MAG TPA: uracil-DNA glycosylase [Candidatus Omnitrophota bacterium]|nr:uracil-DNA glycosylase [Candidatus Omnitrophota bacterium]